VAGFEVIPAIDVRAGVLARLTGGDPGSLERLGGDPMELAARYVEAGARWLHVVDLDIALGGHSSGFDMLERICRLPVLVEAGGGLSGEGVAAALERGAARAILGSAAHLHPEAVPAAVAAHGDRLAVAVDVREGRIAPRGTALRGPALRDVLALMAELRPSLLVYTDAARDGSLAGPDTEGLALVSAATEIPVLASGGVRSLDDVRALRAMWPAVAGVIVGRALHEGAFTVGEALAATA
jgi:phosphoribosyl isomerase A